MVPKWRAWKPKSGLKREDGAKNEPKWKAWKPKSDLKREDGAKNEPKWKAWNPKSDLKREDGAKVECLEAKKWPKTRGWSQNGRLGNQKVPQNARIEPKLKAWKPKSGLKREDGAKNKPKWKAWGAEKSKN